MNQPPPIPPPVYDDITSPEFLRHENLEWKRGIFALTRAQLKCLVDYDNSLLGQKPPKPLPILARLYVGYRNLIKKLDSIYESVYQYQKCQAMRLFIDAATTRFLEIKYAMAEVEISEYHYIDNELIELKVIPQDLEIIPLSAFALQRTEEIRELAERLFRGERIYTPTDPDAVDTEEPEVKVVKPVKRMQIDPVFEEQKETIIIIQKHERARCGRLEFLDEQVAYLLRVAISAGKQIKKVNKDVATKSAIHIQRLWRGYCARRDIKRDYYNKRLAIKMDVPSWKSTEDQQKLKEIDAAKNNKRSEKVKEYINTCLSEKERVYKVITPHLMEDIRDEIFVWFHNWYDTAKTFDKFPTVEEGGTLLVVRGDTLTPEEWLIEQEQIRAELEKLATNPAYANKVKQEAEKKKKEEEALKKKEKERIKKEKKEAKLRAKKGIREPFEFKEGEAYTQIIEAGNAFRKDWTEFDEELSKDDKLVMWRITDEKSYEVQLEIRKIVDEVMRLELQVLQEALETDRNKGVPPKPKPPVKPPKPKKAKKNKDLTANRCIEDLFQELYDEGIIRKYPETYMDSLIGDYSLINLNKRLVDLDPLPSIAEAKQLAINNCVLPLVGNKVPKPKSVLIFGPRESGKKTLVYSICTAASAVMFDLSVANMVGKYPGKPGMKMVVHLVQKMSRILQPSVIFVDGAEKMFYAQVPAAERDLDPKRLKGQLFKHLVKPIKNEDRIMVIGTSKQPFAAKPKQLLKAYESFIMIPRTDYGTCYLLWMDILMKYHGVDRDIDVSALAKMSVGYTVPYLRKVANKVLNTKRIAQLKFKPLLPHEVLEGLMRCGEPDPMSEQEQEKFTSWYNKKTKMGKTRTKIVTTLRTQRVEMEAALAAANAKKK